MATANSTRSTNTTRLDPATTAELNDTQFKNEVLTLCAQLRCAFARLQAVEGYGEPGQEGEALTDVGFALIDGSNRLEGLYERMDTAGVA